MENNTLAQNGEFTLSVEYIQKIVDNYKNNQLATINENLEINDAHSIQFNLKVIKDFIARIEEEAFAVDPYLTEEKLGIRMYYGAYDEVTEEPIPEDYARKHTLVMVPTITTEEDIIEDFNPFASESQTSFGLIPRALSQNHGVLVPPKTNSVESY